MNCFCALARSPFLISSFFLCTKKDTFKDFNRFVLSLNESPFIALTWWHWKNSREKPMGWTSWFLLYWQDEHQQEGECWTEGLWKTELGSLGGFCGWMETSALILVFYLSHCWGPNVEMPWFLPFLFDALACSCQKSPAQRDSGSLLSR